MRDSFTLISFTCHGYRCPKCEVLGKHVTNQPHLVSAHGFLKLTLPLNHHRSLLNLFLFSLGSTQCLNAIRTSVPLYRSQHSIQRHCSPSELPSFLSPLRVDESCQLRVWPSHRVQPRFAVPCARAHGLRPPHPTIQSTSRWEQHDDSTAKSSNSSYPRVQSSLLLCKHFCKLALVLLLLSKFSLFGSSISDSE
jgi:hypothetical protein